MLSPVTSRRLGRLLWLAALSLTLAPGARGEGTKDLGRQLRARLQTVSIPFIANSGQIDPAVAYYAPTFAGTVFVTREGRIVYSLPGKRVLGARSPDTKTNGWSLTETPVGGRADPKGSDPASTGVSYFLGSDPARWRSGLQTFQAVSLGEIWPGIALELRAHGKNVEKIFTVNPGGDPSRIRMSLTGARSLRVSEKGALVIGTGTGNVVLTPPVAFQERRGVRHWLSVAYELNGQKYGFRVGDYDPALPVLIDPLLQATYLGGSRSDGALALAIDPASGDVYVAGDTASTNFPGTAGGAQAVTSDGVNGDAFVARLNSALTALKQATYLGGSNRDEAVALAIHPTSGEVYVAGATLSADFPGTSGGAQATYSGNSDAFVARLNAALTTLRQATYLGGTDGDEASALAIHPTTGDVYVTGGTRSTDFPGTFGGAQPFNRGSTDAFAARLNASLNTLTQATYLGGTGGDGALAIAINPASGQVYIAGGTISADFPGTAGGAQPVAGGAGDAFVARLNAGLTTLGQATYLGGSAGEEAFALAIYASTGEVYIAGSTPSADFPGTAGGAQPVSGGGSDAFVARMNAALTTLNQASYLGGSGTEDFVGLAIHSSTGEVYIAGSTSSTDFPGTAGGVQQAFGGGFSDVFAARLNHPLTTLNQATYLGGNGNEPGFRPSLAIHPNTGELYVAGATSSTDFPGSAGGAQAANGGNSDAFIARLSADLIAPTPLPTVTNTPTNTPTAPPLPPPVVPTLSFPMLALLAFALGAIGLLVSQRGRP